MSRAVSVRQLNTVNENIETYNNLKGNFIHITAVVSTQKMKEEYRQIRNKTGQLFSEEIPFWKGGGVWGYSLSILLKD